MVLATTRWDSAEHLKTEEDIRLYLEPVLKKRGMTLHSSFTHWV